jgi:3-oxoadipate enol-lactonase
MPHLEANGQTLYYEVHGDGEPLLLVQGLAIDHFGWLAQVPEWSKHYKVVSFDNRDIGQSSYAEGPYELTDMAQDTLALADGLGLDTFHLLGLSMGGAIAQHIALTAPERVRTLTLCVTWGGSGYWGELYGELLGTAFSRLTPEEGADNFMLLVLSEEFFQNREAVQAFRAAVLANPFPQRAEGFARQAAASGRHETRDRLGELQMPVHVIGAAHDRLVPVWKSEELARLMPDSKLTILDGAPHGVNWERAEDFNQTVLPFLAATPSEAIR